MSKNIGKKEEIALGISSAVLSKTLLAPLERVKLLVQCQDEIIKTGRLSGPFRGVLNCVKQTFQSEGLLPFWRGYVASFLSYFSTQMLSFALKDQVKVLIPRSEKDSQMAAFAKNTAAGGAAGVMALSVVYSIDFTRIRLANDVIAAGKGGSERQFKGLIDVYAKIFKSDGIVGLYRGFVVSCAGICVYRGCYFGLYDTLKPLLLSDNASYIASYMLGFAVTLTAGLISYPLDTVRCRMVMTSGQPVKYKGSVDCASQILKNEGAMSFMKGLSVNIVRGFTGAVFLAGYNKFKPFYTKWRLSD